MCLSSVFFEDESTPVMDRVAAIRVNGTEIELEDLMGRVLEVSGTVKDVDLLENKIVLERCE